MAKKVRVYELARELSLSSEALVKTLREMEVPVKSHMSTVDEATVSRMRERLTKQREAVKQDAERKKKLQAEIARKQVETRTGTGTTAGAGDASRKRDRKRRRGRKRRPVDQQAVQRSVKETLATMGGGARTRRRRKEARVTEGAEATVASVTEFITVGELANQLEIDPNEIIKYCLGLGIMANINKRLERDVIELIADEFAVKIEFGAEYGAEVMDSIRADEEDVALETRPPVVTIMGHVDHGKTSLLDFVRRSRVVAGEAGGITQHIGAYEVPTSRGSIVFLDTPGHEAFTAMRARGAEATDIVVLVVAANDGVMPQTLEAIDHARAAKVPIIVAVNKIDLPDANPQQVRQELSKHSLVPEDWGGDSIFVDISAKKGDGVEKLLEMVSLVAEMRDLKASWERNAKGIVVESSVDQGRGIVATVLVQDGVLRVGESFVCGAEGGRVRALYNDRGERINEVTPSKPVEILGWSGVPQAGDAFQVLKDEQKARDIMSHRQQIRREQQFRRRAVVNLANLHQQIQQGEIQDLNVIVKADTQGSVEVLCDAFEKLTGDEIRVNIIHRGVGNVTESDVLLAAASTALIFGFHVRKEGRANATAEREKVDVNLYDVIYEAVDELKLAVEGMLKPELIEHTLGRAEVRQIFRIPKQGQIAGSFVASGSASRSSRARLIRDGETLFEGRLSSLRRFKDDVKEVEAGLDCGIALEGFDAVQEGDVIEFYETEQVLRKIS